MLAIELRGVTKNFGSERILDEVDLEVPRGEITVLLGPSGAGKTVTIRHIVGLLRPTRGRVAIDGVNLAGLSDDELNCKRRHMGVVLQGTLPFTCGLFFSLDVLENVAFGVRERTRLPEATIERIALEHLDMVGLRDWAKAKPDQLSSGMCKRVAIARALALEAEIVIIDDFDSGIDGVRLALLCDLLQEVQANSDTTFLLSTHDMAAARRLADHVAVIHEGRIVSSGPADSVFRSNEPVTRQLVWGDTEGPIGLASEPGGD
jgi:phospholipid/cholesterol/gamma-HCH transport system ATP-binding protein